MRQYNVLAKRAKLEADANVLMTGVNDIFSYTDIIGFFAISMTFQCSNELNFSLLTKMKIIIYLNMFTCTILTSRKLCPVITILCL